jgi:hypothetical protein
MGMANGAGTEVDVADPVVTGSPGGDDVATAVVSGGKVLGAMPDVVLGGLGPGGFETPLVQAASARQKRRPAV